MDRDEVVIVSAARTPVGKFLGGLAPVPTVELGGVAIRAALERAGIDGAQVDEVLMGNVIQAGEGQAPARQAAFKAGIPITVGATTVNKVCGSGLKAVMWAAQAIKAGDAKVIVAGGMENMSAGPYLLPRAREGLRLGHTRLLDASIHDGLWDPTENWHMGDAAEFIADEFEITRQEQDAYALESHKKALATQEAGKFKAEIVPVTAPQPKGEPKVIDRDEGPRPDTSIEALAKLKPAFQENGTVTAGNAPTLNDGAAALVVMRKKKAEELGITPLAHITGYAGAAVEPKWIFAAPVHAIRRLLEKTGYRLEDFDLIEVNEAFAAQILANGKELGWDWSKVNVHGGAIALGHPLGATGARILTTLLYAMQARGAHLGMACLCLGGGEAVALSVERG
ncbi:MAG: acetyl-CoA C-acetyltransferase [Chloroflexi bacterium]|nr:acetyl-CoA C-acetyltransferase [Chloroflexota bacterium]